MSDNREFDIPLAEVPAFIDGLISRLDLHMRAARRWKAKAKELRKLRVAAKRWEAFHDDCTCGAATVHTTTETLRGGELRRLVAALLATYGTADDDEYGALAALRAHLEGK